MPGWQGAFFTGVEGCVDSDGSALHFCAGSLLILLIGVERDKEGISLFFSSWKRTKRTPVAREPLDRVPHVETCHWHLSTPFLTFFTGNFRSLRRTAKGAAVGYFPKEIVDGNSASFLKRLGQTKTSPQLCELAFWCVDCICLCERRRRTESQNRVCLQRLATA